MLATRDRIQWARQAVQSIVDQTYAGHVEVLVVFDQSDPDRSFEHESPGRRVRVLRNERQRGLAGARNHGALQATGLLLAFCDDDDSWMPDKLEQQVARLEEEPSTEVVVTGMTVVYENRTLDRVWHRDTIELTDLARSRVQDAHPSSVLVRRGAFLDGIGMIDESLPGSYGEDRDWMLRAARRAPLAVVRAPLVRVRWHRGGSFFSERWSTIIEAIDHLAAKHPEVAADPVGMAHLDGRKAFALAALGQRRPARRTAVSVLRRRPLDQRAWVALAVSSGVVSPQRAIHLAHRRGRGI